MLYKLAALPNNVEPEDRLFTTIGEDGVIKVSDAVQSFYMDTITGSGRSTLFSKSIVEVSEITEEVLSLVMPQILFQVRSPLDLEVFAETFSAHLDVCNEIPELHIELDLTWNMDEDLTLTLGKWTASELPHGRGFMKKFVTEWFRAIELLPESTNVHMIFSKIWRDFRELRGLSTKFGVCKRLITFQFEFPTAGLSDEDIHFYKAQTLAAVKDVEVAEQINISTSKREALVKLGCRGFNQVRQRPNA
jgi:hypothetical protein